MTGADLSLLSTSSLTVEAHRRAQQQAGGAIVVGRLVYTGGADPFARYAAERTDRRVEILLAVQPEALHLDSVHLSVPREKLPPGVDPQAPVWAGRTVGDLARETGLPVVTTDAVEQRPIPFCDVPAWIERTARRDVEIFLAHAHLLPYLHLARFREGGVRALVLRRALLQLPFPSGNVAAALRPILGLRDGETFLYEYLYWSTVRTVVDRETWRRMVSGTAILMYHAFGRPASRYVLPVHRFVVHLFWLKLMRYRVVPLCEYLEDRVAHRLTPARTVVITVDDGYDDFRRVLPWLRIFGFPATIFAVSGAPRNEWDGAGPLAGRPLLTAQGYRELLLAGIEVGAHTRTHPRLTEIDPVAQTEEVAGSRRDLEERLGEPVGSFSYPHGCYDAAVAEVVQMAGFLGACGSHSGLNGHASPAFELRRLEVRGTDRLWQVALALDTGRWYGRRR